MPNPDIQDLIYKYPEIFRQHGLSMKETCMCWGIECGSGWNAIVDSLCDAIQNYIDQKERPLCFMDRLRLIWKVLWTGKTKEKVQVEFTQVKEKYAGLRVYCNSHDEVVNNLIGFAEHLSFRTCEACGATWHVKQDARGYIQTLCETCRNKRDIKIRQSDTED